MKKTQIYCYVVTFRLKFEQAIGTRDEQRLRRLTQHLPAVCDALHFYFTLKSKSTAFYDTLVNELVKSTSFTAVKSDMVYILEILLKEAPEWCCKDFVLRDKSKKEILFTINKNSNYGAMRKRMCKLALDSRVIVQK